MYMILKFDKSKKQTLHFQQTAFPYIQMGPPILRDTRDIIIGIFVTNVAFVVYQHKPSAASDSCIAVSVAQVKSKTRHMLSIYCLFLLKSCVTFLDIFNYLDFHNNVE